MERRTLVQDRRQDNGSQLPAERRRKDRRKGRKFVGSPLVDGTHIDVTQQDELLYWSEELDVSADILKAAVEKVGPNLKAVREHLGKP